MIGLVLVTHTHLADEFLAALKHIVGEQENIETVCINADADMEQCRRNILDKVRRVEKGDGVIVLTDMFGGTPSNLAISIMDKANVEVLAGLNLPMLIKLASARKDKTLKEAVVAAREAGKKYINIASEILGQ